MSADVDDIVGLLATRLGFCTREQVAVARAAPGRAGQALVEVLRGRGVLTEASALLLGRLGVRLAEAPDDAMRALTRGEVDGSTQLVVLPEEAPPALEEQPARYSPVEAPAGVPLGPHIVLWRDAVLGRDVAAKVSPGDDEALLEEARLTGQLGHPAVVPVYEYGRRANGEAYCAMQRVAGRTLDLAIAEAPTVEERLSLLPAFLVTCRCVAAAHDVGVAHRGLSPEGIVLGKFGEVYVLDWSKAQRAAPKAALRGDLEQLGGVLWLLLTDTVGRFVPGLPADLLAISRRARASEAAGGFESVGALARELTDFLAGRTVASHRYSAGELLRRFVGRHRPLAVALAMMVVFLGGMVWLAQTRVRQERDQARQFAQRFLDDVARTLTAAPGEEALVRTVTATAVAHYRRTTELERAPAAERTRVARALLRLVGFSLAQGDRQEVPPALSLARSLAERLVAEDPSGEALLLLAEARGLDASLAALDGQTVEARRLHLVGGLELARRAMAGRVNGAPLLAADLARRLSELSDGDERLELAREAVRLATVALFSSPDDAALQRCQAQALMQQARLAEDEGPELLETALELLRTAYARAPDEVAVRVTLGEALLQRAASLEAQGALAAAAATREEARRTAEVLLEQHPEASGALRLSMVAEAGLGRTDEAWVRLQAAERQRASGALDDVAPAVAFWAGHDAEAVRLSLRPEVATSPGSLLYRALAEAERGRLPEALEAARAARGRSRDAPWPVRVAYRRIVVEGGLAAPGRLAALRYAVARDAAEPAISEARLEAALEGFITELEHP